MVDGGTPTSEKRATIADSGAGASASAGGIKLQAGAGGNNLTGEGEAKGLLAGDAHGFDEEDAVHDTSPNSNGRAQ